MSHPESPAKITLRSDRVYHLYHGASVYMDFIRTRPRARCITNTYNVPWYGWIDCNLYSNKTTMKHKEFSNTKFLFHINRIWNTYNRGKCISTFVIAFMLIMITCNWYLLMDRLFTYVYIICGQCDTYRHKYSIQKE